MSNIPDMSNITAVVLAGGLGTRLQTAVHDRPKILAEISGRPYITYLFDQLIETGILDVLLCTGYMAEQVFEALGDSYRSLTIRYSRENSPLGTGGALRNALPLISSDPVIVMNGDSFINTDLGGYVKWFFQKDRNVSILLTYVANSSRYGTVILSDDGHLIRFDEKCAGINPGWINAGVYILKKKQISKIPEKTYYSLEKEFFPKLIGDKIYGFPCKGSFIDIGTPKSYKQAESFFTELL